MKDGYGRDINYLRLSLTGRCNFRCKYCMPEEGIEKLPRKEILSFEEIVNLVGAASELGINKVRFTGGEPLTRKDLPGLVEMVDEIEGIDELSLTTNGSSLSGVAKDLSKAGLNRVNISIDAIDPEVFAEITRGGELSSVLAGIEAAKEAGLEPVKLNTVVMKGVNESEIAPLMEFAAEEGLVLRFIELMPMGEAAGGAIDPKPLDEVKRDVERVWSLEKVSGLRGNGPAEYFRASRGDLSGKVGFIFPLSKSFCDGCNRIRITSRGRVRPCLARDEEYDLEINEDTSVDDISSRLRKIIKDKPYGHKWEKHDETAGEMSEIGG
ncbi:MAG: GTP 3',8-cyclase MoaA [Candidatus Bipolaricaulota bacterium]|nr:GTP 3',8-cyclase MoaA [Candidatus Bipolaricaulota bacterium]MBS3791443.1 GTP 3',8-cyclase MoaA [Candidatus Bipolaricaulota bacterium]